jgi:hypothetical protein
MARIIHAQQIKDDVLRFRIWSSTTGTYLTPEMTEAQVRQWLLKETLDEALEQYWLQTDKLIQKAILHGTSSLINRARNLRSPWSKQRK